MKKKKKAVVIILVAALLMIATFMDIWLVFQVTSGQTRDLGSYQLANISGELENTISRAEKLTMQIGITAETYIGDEQAITEYIYRMADELASEETGLFNVYIAGPGWNVLPGMTDPNFDATKRDWYIGAIKNDGSTYVTSPYADAVTGDMCYTVSLMLADGETVIAVDYTMNIMQAYIRRIYAAGSSDAVILTEEGIIAGCSDETMIGKKLSDVLPEYVGLFSLAKNKDEVVIGKVRKDNMTENVFVTKSGNGWFFIVGESNWKLYGGSYLRLLVTVGVSLAVFAVIIVLYLLAARNQKNAEAALESKTEFLNRISRDLKDPLNRIMETSGKEGVAAMEDYEEAFAGIHAAGEKLSEMIGQMMSYSRIVKSEEKKKEKKTRATGLSKNVRNMILLFMIVTMVISLYTSVYATYRWGNEKMQKEAAKYEYQVSEWVNTQKDILDVFCSEFSTRPELLEDYEGAVEYLRRMTVQYPEISASYMANPELEHTVIMNTGWQPDEGWHVEERQWYKDTIASEAGWSVSAPYVDDQTGGYCITISKIVYDYDTGEFLGIFGVDFFMDKLVDILGGSYSDTGYAFLVDPQGEIVNHPYGSFQMSENVTVNVSESVYKVARIGEEKTSLIKDYDGKFRILAAVENKESHFAVYVVSNLWMIYGRVFVFGAVCLASFLLAIIMVYRLLSNLIRWQSETNRKMQESADAAIAAGKAKSQFLAQMSHEIRTPINAVLGMNEMILRESKEKDILDYSANIQSAGKNLLSIINTILDFSKIEDGKMEIVPDKYDVADMVNNLVNSISERAKAKSLELKVSVDESIPYELWGDDVRISQVIMNLLTNAVKYTEQGSVSFVMNAVEKTADDAVLGVEVRDTGIGIKAEDMDKLFASFERIEEQRNRNIEGTGLGMSIVTKLLDMMDSKLEVSSKYGEGSVFSFKIRQQIINAEPVGDYTERIRTREHTADEETILLAPDAKVLLVDDNDMNLKVARSLLKLNDIHPDTCMSGAECLEKLKEKAYDIVFLDHMMPKMDGVETLKHIQEEGLKPEGMKIIALTANAVNSARDRYIALGFDDFLSKPIEVKSLVDILRKYLPAEKITERKLASESTAPEADADDDLFIFSPDDDAADFETGTTYADVSELPAVEGADWNYALSHLVTAELVAETVKEFRRVIPSHADKLNEFYAALPDEEALKGYRIQVHAMKSSAATVGIIPLAGMAKVLEDAAANANSERVFQLHDVFESEWRSYEERLKDF